MSITAREIILQNAVSATGNGTNIDVDGMSAVAFQITGTFSATITFQGTCDGVTFFNLNASSLTTAATNSNTATAAGIWVAPCAGLRKARATVTWTSGTSVTVIANATDAAYGRAS